MPARTGTRTPPAVRPGREAPVAYADIRVRLQRGRALLGACLLAVSITLTITGTSSSGLPHAGATLLVADAILRLLRADDSPLGSFLVDAVTIGVTVTASGGVLAPLVALLTYLLVGTILLVPQPGTIWVMAVAGAAFALTAAGVPSMEDFSEQGLAGAAIWLQLALLFTAAALLLLEGAGRIREARRRQAEALESERRASEIKTQFVSTVTHELRTPLTNISGFAATLREAWRDLDPAEVDEFLAIVGSEAEHLGNLVDDVLAIPRLEAGRLLVDVTDFLLQPLAYRIADLIFPAGGDKVASVQVAGNVVVRADPNRVEQVLRNLLGNARKYGGNRVGIETVPRGDLHVIVVADNGPGVPEADRDRIFEQFEQVSRGDTRTDHGVGLGLSITKRLVEAMDGEVWYEPGFPVGARFCFSLPAGEAAAEPAGHRPAGRVA